MKHSRGWGIFLVFFSAVVFGFTPVLANLSYAGGNNGINMSLLRGVISLPVILVLARFSAPSFRADRRQLLIGFALGWLQFGCTLMLYSSYSYIPLGIATTLHFLYPLFVMLWHVLRYRENPGKMKWLGLLLSLAGALLLVEMGEGGLSPLGMGLALLSGVVFAAYIILLQKEAERPMPLYHLMASATVSGSVLCIIVGGIAGRLTLALTPQAWLYAAMAAVLVSIGGSAVFQAGVRIVGDADAAVYSLLEPLTSIVFGLLLLGERFTLRKGVSCALILTGLLITALADRRKHTYEVNDHAKV